METLGVDLAAQSDRTCACRIDWSRPRPLVKIIDWEKPRDWRIDDKKLAALVCAPAFAAVGVDVPFGWPIAFKELLAGSGTFTSYDDDADRLRLRETDHFCAKTTGVTPLSVSADMIAAPAMRWCVLRARMGASASRAHEVYPAAALAAWGLPHHGYKKAAQSAERATACKRLGDLLALDLDAEHTKWITESHDALDAVVAAIVARAIALGRVHP